MHKDSWKHILYFWSQKPKVERTSFGTLGALLLFPIIAFILKRDKKKHTEFYYNNVNNGNKIGNLKC